jgi:hypothetical protein
MTGDRCKAVSRFCFYHRKAATYPGSDSLIRQINLCGYWPEVFPGWGRRDYSFIPFCFTGKNRNFAAHSI